MLFLNFQWLLDLQSFEHHSSLVLFELKLLGLSLGDHRLLVELYDSNQSDKPDHSNHPCYSTSP